MSDLHSHSPSPGSRLQRLLRGGVEFAEGEEYPELQFRFLYALLLIGALCTLLYVVGDATGISPLPAAPLWAIRGHLLITIGLIWSLYGNKAAYGTISIVFMGMSIAVFLSALVFDHGDELRTIWLLLGVIGTFLLTGRRIGVAAGVLSTISFAVVNALLPDPYSPEAITSGLMGLFFVTLFFNAYTGKTISFFRRMVESNLKLRETATRLEEKNRKLEAALQEVAALREIIPICASCRKVRNDEGLYEAAEEYFSRHLNADLSHTVCPECLKEQYPELSQGERSGRTAQEPEVQP